MHLTGILVAEQGGSFAQTHRQIAVGSCSVQVDLILEGASHRTQRKALLALVIGVAHNEHTVTIVIPVAGDLVQIGLCHQRGLGQQVATLLFLILHPTLQGLDNTGTLWQQDGQALADLFHGGEEFQFTAQLIVVPLQCLCLALQIQIQLFLAGECNAVDSLQHLAVTVATPVSAAGLGQLKAIVLDTARVVHVRASAQIGKLTLGVEADDSIFGQVIDQFHLVGLVQTFHIGNSLFPGLLAALQTDALLANLLHLRFNFLQMLGSESEGGIEVIVEAFLDGRTDGQLHLGPQPLDSLGHNVGGGVPVGLTEFRVLKSVDVFVFHSVFLLFLWTIPQKFLIGGALPLLSQLGVLKTLKYT